MADKTAGKARDKGTGNIFKDKNRFYLRVRVNGKSKSSMLRNPDGSPATTKRDAEAAAVFLRPVLLAKQKEEIALHMAEARKLRRQSGLTLNDAWTTYLKQPIRPDSGPKTLRNYLGIWTRFTKWLNNAHPEKSRVADIDNETAEEYFATLWDKGLSARTFNENLQALTLMGASKNAFSNQQRENIAWR